MITSRSLSPRRSPYWPSRITPSARGVRTKGIMIFTLVRPMVSRTAERLALHRETIDKVR